MKRTIAAFLAIFLCLCVWTNALADTLAYEGKAVAQMVRNVHIPFPMYVDKLLVKTGEDVRKEQRLLEYHLDPADERHVQYEIISGGEATSLIERQASIETHMANSAAQRATSAEMAAKGLASQSAAARDSKIYSSQQRQHQALQQQKNAALAARTLRLKEFESYFGVPVKTGARLPQQLFLTAPISGTVINISAQARPMGVIAANATAMSIAELNPIQVQMQVYETEITRISVGQEVTVEVANRKGVVLHGRISTISWQPVDPTIAVPSFYDVYVDVDNPEHFIKPGYKVIVKVDVK